MSPLVAALRAGGSDTKTNAATTLASLTSTEAGRSQLRAAGGVGALVDVLLSDGAAALHEAVCTVFANLCDDNTDDWKLLLQSGAIFSLVPMLNTPSPGLQQEALTLLAMLSSRGECREQIADANAVPALCRLLASSNVGVSRAALAVAHHLSASRRGAQAMVEAGGASPLASMLAGSGAGNAEVATAVLECLAQLTDAGLPQTQGAVRNAGAVPQLIQLMSHQNSRISSAASSLIATLCPGDVQASEQLYEAGGIVMLAEQLQSPSEGAQLQAVSALSQLSAAPAQSQAIVDNGCVRPLLGLLDHPNAELKSYAAICFGNLCTSGALSPAQLQHSSMLPHLVRMLSSSNALAKGPAAAAIAAMCGQPLRQSVYDLGGLPAIASLLQSDPDTSYHAVQAVAQFAADERYRSLLPEIGAMAPLAALVASHLPHVQKCALSAVANSSFVPTAAGPLCASGALTQLGQLLFSTDAETQKMCLTTLCNLLGAQGGAAHAEELVRVGGHMALLTQLSAPAAEAQAQAAMAIGHMGKQPAALQSLVQADTVPLLCKLLHSAHPSVQLQAVYALGIFAAEDEGAASAIQLAGAVAPLTTLLLSGASVDVKQHLALTLAHVARGNWRPVFNVGGFQALLDVLAVGSDAVQCDVSAAIATMVDDVHQRRALLSDMNSVSAIVGLLSSPNLKTQQHAAAALAALAQEPVAREALYRLGTLSHVIRSLTAAELRQQDGGADADAAAARVSMVRVVAAFAGDTRYCDMLRITIQPLVAMLAATDATVVVHAAAAVTSLSRSEPNRDALRDAGALRRMAELLLHPHESVPQAAVQCIANLGVDASSAKGFLAAGWHLSLIGLLSSPSADVAASAAAVLGNLSSAPEFRHALMADGALQPILQLLHAPALPTRTAAVRALAIMSQQLMSTELPRGDASAAQFVAAIFDSAALPVLLKELDGAAAAPPPPPPPAAATADPAADAAAAAAATAARMLIAVLLLLQNLAGGYGDVRPRLVDGGAVGALLRFLSSHVAGDSGQLTPAAAAASGEAEVLDAAASTLAALVLTPAGAAALDAAGGAAALLPLRRVPRPELQAPLCRALGNLAHDGAAAALAPTALAALLAVAAKPKLAAAVAVDALWALGNLHSLCRDAFAEGAAVELAAFALRAVAGGGDGRLLAVAILRDLALRADGRKVLAAAGADAALRDARRAAEPGGGGRALDLLVGMIATSDLVAPPVANGGGAAAAAPPPAAAAPPPAAAAPPPAAAAAPPPPAYEAPPPAAPPQYQPPPAAAAPPVAAAPSSFAAPPLVPQVAEVPAFIDLNTLAKKEGGGNLLQ